MGTMLDVLFAGCVPITTRACGVDDEVLDRCLIVEAMRPGQHRSVIEDVVHWSVDEWRARSDALQRVARRRHQWTSFDRDVGGALAGLLDVPERRSDEIQAIH
jgi:hypothetical protein